MPLLGATGGGSAKGFGALANLGYFIKNSLRFRGSATGYLTRTPGSAGNRKTWTWSAWIKLGTISTNMGVLFGAQGQTAIYLNDGTNSSFRVNGAAGSDLITNLMPRDPSAWYHLVVTCDTTQATEANRLKIYVNGVQQTSFQAGSAYPTLNGDTYFNSTALHTIGRRSWNSDQQFDGYMAEINFIDGQALTPSSFGKTDAATGQWIPKKFGGTYGTNGFYLKFADASAATAAAIGKDSSGNGNNWTPNNISVTSGVTYDAMIDVPTNTSATVANYAVLNPLMSGAPFQTNAAATVSQGNLQVDWTTTGQGSILSTIAMTSGKWYFEGTVTGTNTREVIGIVNSSAATTTYVGGDANGWGYFSVNGQKYNNGSATSYGATYTTNDIIGVAFDADAGSLTFYKNGTSQGTAFTGLSAGTYFFAVADANSSLTCGWNVNFGQRPFSYTPPTGYKALNTYNLP
jgi:hypothetical protein